LRRPKRPPPPIPERYETNLEDRFADAVRPFLKPGIQVLDVGSGRRPALPVSERPPRTRYVGLDLSSAELALAPSGAYDEAIAGDASERRETLIESFDLILSFQVFEHVRPLDRALDNLQDYLRPGGHLVASLSGSFSVHGVLNRALPGSIGPRLMARLLTRREDTVFPAYYDGCHHAALERMLRPWSWAQVAPVYVGGAYFTFSPALLAAYLRYEDWARNSARAKLAPYYLIVAQR
jgi:SAM-dependent methyltransferase